MDLTETFWAGFYTFTGGFVLAVLALAYKSKCSNVSVCWGGIVINRAVDIELQEDLRFRDPVNA
jgi:DNA-binding protein